MSGRPKTTGRFRTRAELVDRVRNLYHNTSLSMAAVARNCQVSPGVADDIITRKDWESLMPHDYLYSDPADDGASGVLRHDQEPFESVHLDPRSLTVCGSGYDFPLYPLHIPDRIKRDLDIV
jgi:hypothetical protein